MLLSDYYPKARNSSRLFAQCKTCFRERQGSKPAPEKRDALYVMSCSVLEGVYKVGRSMDVEARAREMQASQPYYVTVVATFPEQGCIEAAVHSDLACFRVLAPGREWFELPLQDILTAIARRMA
jgi:hypothetical protein